MASLAEAPTRTTERAERRRAKPLIATLPAVAWLLAFFAAPLLVFLVYSFLTNELYAVGLPFTLEAYADALTSSLNRTLARNSLVVGLLTAVDHGDRRLADRLLAALRRPPVPARGAVPDHGLDVRELPRAHLRLAHRAGQPRADQLRPGASRADRRAPRVPALQPLRGHGGARAHLPALRGARALRGHGSGQRGPARVGAATSEPTRRALAARAPAAHGGACVQRVRVRLHPVGRRLRDARSSSAARTASCSGVQIQQNFIAVGNWPLGGGDVVPHAGSPSSSVYAIGSFALRLAAARTTSGWGADGTSPARADRHRDHDRGAAVPVRTARRSSCSSRSTRPGASRSRSRGSRCGGTARSFESPEFRSAVTNSAFVGLVVGAGDAWCSARSRRTA